MSGSSRARAGTWVSKNCSRRTGANGPLGELTGLALGGLREELERVDQLSVRENLVVQMRTGRASRGPDVADDVAAFDAGARFHGEPAQMSVAGGQPEVVPQGEQVPILAGIGSRIDLTVGGRIDGLTLFGRNIEALMERGLARERIGPAAEPAR